MRLPRRLVGIKNTAFHSVFDVKAKIEKKQKKQKRHQNVKKSTLQHTTMPKTRAILTKEDAEKSADEWVGSGESLMRSWLIQAIMDPKQHRDIGKVLANVAEIHVNQWLRDKTGRVITSVVGESYDGKTDDEAPLVRHQIKFRMDAWHFETTRRNSQKNVETNSTGHVAYKKDEFDLLVIFQPSSTFGISNSSIRCIPVEALIHPHKPDQLIPHIPASIRKIYDSEEKTEEVLSYVYHRPPLPQD